MLVLLLLPHDDDDGGDDDTNYPRVFERQSEIIGPRAAVVSWTRGRTGNAPLNFTLSENFLPKIPNVGLEFGVKIEILSTDSLLCRKCSVSVGNLQLAAAYLLTHPRRRR